MTYEIKPELTCVSAPPISESFSWVPEAPHERAFITLSQAVPGYPPADALQSAMAELIHRPETSLYTDILGIEPLRAALADHLTAQYGGQVKASEIAITAGCNQAFSLAMLALCRAGDNIILPVPYYFNHQMWPAMNGIEPRYLTCDAQSGMLPDLDAADKLIDGKTKAILLVTPNNPSGANYPAQLVEAFAALASKHGIALLVDETYKDFRDQTGPPHGLFTDPGWRDTVIHLYSFSKVFALTGYRVGSLSASSRFIGEIEKLMDCVAICAPRIGQDAALFGLRELGDWVDERRFDMRQRADALRSAFEAPDLKYRLVSSGAFFGYIRHPFAGESATSVAKRLARDHGLLILPGEMFGPGQEQFMRVAFANAEAGQMDDVAARLIESQRLGSMRV